MVCSCAIIALRVILLILFMCQYENKKSQIEMFLKIWIFIS